MAGFCHAARGYPLADGRQPGHLTIENVISAMVALGRVEGVHHVHVWQLDEHCNALETHVVSNAKKLADIEDIKSRLRTMLLDRFDIGHSTLEFECVDRAQRSAGFHESLFTKNRGWSLIMSKRGRINGKNRLQKNA